MKGLLRVFFEETEWIYIQELCQTFNGLEAQISFTALNAAHVRSMHTDLFRERLLAQPKRFTMQAQVAPESPL